MTILKLKAQKKQCESQINEIHTIFKEACLYFGGIIVATPLSTSTPF